MDPVRPSPPRPPSAERRYPERERRTSGTERKTCPGAIHQIKSNELQQNGRICAYRNVDFGMLPVFLLQLLQSLLLFLPLLLIQTLQVLSPLVLLQHLVAFELLMPLGVVVLEVLGGLKKDNV